MAADELDDQILDQIFPDAALELPPLPPPYAPAPNLPPDMVPEPLRRFANDIAERMCCPLEYVVVPALTALATVIGSTIRIHPKQYDDWTVYLNIWAMVIGPPSAMKSPAQKQAIKPLTVLEKRAKEQFRDDKKKSTADLAIAERDAKRLLDQIGKQSSSRDLDELAYKDKRAEIDELKAVTERRYWTSDSTKEALAKLFEQNPHGILLLRDELFGWLSTMATEARAGERQFFLECWDGSGYFREDRITREGTNADLMCLSVLGSIQPGRLDSLVRSASDDKSAENDGLLQRLQLMVDPERPPWKLIDRPPDREAERCVTALFERLDAFARGIRTDQPVIMRFDPPAQGVFNAWLDDHERKLRTADVQANPLLEEHLGKYRSLVPKLAAIFELANMFAEIRTPATELARMPEESYATFATPVSADSARMAVFWCGYLEAHVRKIYAGRSAESAAHALADRIMRLEVEDGSTIRDLDRHHFSGLETTARCQAAAEVLERIGWLSLVQPPKAQGRGRQPTSPKLVFADGLKAAVNGRPA